MQWKILNPLTSTGFLLPDGCGQGRDILIDLSYAGPSLQERLESFGSGIERVDSLFITHLHADHFLPAEALELAKAGCRILIEREAWTLMQQLRGEGEKGALLRACCDEIEGFGVLKLLGPSGEMPLGERHIAWATYPHGNGDIDCDNLAFLVDDHLFTGDTSITSFFDESRPDGTDLVARNAGDTRFFFVNIAHVSREDIHSRTDLNERRIRNYLTNHGILEDLVAVIESGSYSDFFAGLDTIVPYHIRKAPLEETAKLMRGQLLSSALKMGYGYEVLFPDRTDTSLQP
ncbi:MAG: MBL fold metallo-hydrolase [Planctomycetota bacterium]|nr:MBL fold metallo-hydrolase [Planctomycetota bacterium]